MIEILNSLQPLLMALLGGLLATIGSIIAIRQQAQLARHIRMEERFAEKKIEVNAQAYKKAKVIQAMLVQARTQDVLAQLAKDEEWLFEQRLFLPGKFPAKWLAVRGCLTELTVRESSAKRSDKSRETALWQRAVKLTEEALHEVYRDMGLKPMEIELLDSTVSELREK